MSATRPAPLLRIYEAMTAGSFPSAAEEVDALRTTLYHAQEFLHTDRAHVLLAEEGGTTFFLAVPSLALTGHPAFATPLACALPGHPGHQGDAAYVLRMGTHDAAVLRRGEQLSLRCGYAEEVSDAIRQEAEELQELPLPVVEVQPGHARRMVSEAWWYRGLAEKTARLTGLVCLGVIAVCAGIVIVVKVFEGLHDARRQAPQDAPQRIAAAADKALDQAPLVSPLSQRVVRLSELFAATTRAGGWIEGYTYTPDRGEAFTATLPAWASADVVRALGEGVTTEVHADDAGLLWARRADRQGKHVRGAGPVDIGTAPPLRAAPATTPGAARKGRP